VMPNNVGTKLKILQNHGLNELDAIDKQTVNFSKNEASFLCLFGIYIYIYIYKQTVKIIHYIFC
jgi:hypothetical protein